MDAHVDPGAAVVAAVAVVVAAAVAVLEAAPRIWEGSVSQLAHKARVDIRAQLDGSCLPAWEETQSVALLEERLCRRSTFICY